MARIGFELRSGRLQLQRSKPINYTAELNLQGFSGPVMMYEFEKIVHPKRQKEELKIAKIKIYMFFCKILYRNRPSLLSLLIRFGYLTCNLFNYYIRRDNLVFLNWIWFGYFFFVIELIDCH